MEPVLLICSLFLIVLLALYCFISIIFVQDNNVVILQSWGKYKSLLSSGIHLINPITDSLKRVNWSRQAEDNGKVYKEFYNNTHIPICEQCYDPPPLDCFTSDHIKVSVNLVTNYLIFDPVKSVYSIDNLWLCIQNVLETHLLNSVINIPSSEITSNKLEVSLLHSINKEIEHWGARFTKIKVQEVKLPNNIIEMLNQNHCSRQLAESKQAQIELDTKTFVLQATLEQNKLKHKLSIEKQELDHSLSIEKLKNDAKLAYMESESKILSIPSNKEIKLAEINSNIFKDILQKANTIVVPYEAARYIGTHINVIDAK